MISYQIHVSDGDGCNFLLAAMDNLSEARKLLSFAIQANDSSNLVVKSSSWRSIELWLVNSDLVGRICVEY